MPNANSTDSYEYQYPLEKGTPVNINDTETHLLMKSTENAIDFLCPEGTPVRAARDGVVVLVKSDSNRAIPFEEMRGMVEEILGHKIPEEEKEREKIAKEIIKAIQQVHAEHTNRVVIKHSDGTAAEYGHLGFNQVVVQGEQEVKAGDLLGYIGMTGVTTTPHLHFNVFQKQKDLERTGQSISVKFVQNEINQKISAINSTPKF